MQAPILVRADISKPFYITTDARNTHVRGVSQVQPDGTGKAIGYFSKKLKPEESRYSTVDREADQHLVSIFKMKTKSPRINRWLL